MSRVRWPWYSFLYRLFGAHGTFWLWGLASAGMWLSFGDAVLVLRNQQILPCSQAEIPTLAPWRLWVALEGTELVDVGRLLGEPGRSGSAVRLLLDPGDTATRRWSELARMAARFEAPPPIDAELQRSFGRRVAQFRSDRSKYLPARALRLFGEAGVAPVVSRCALGRPEFISSDDPLENYRRSLAASAALVRENVRIGQRQSGLLASTPAVAIDDIEGEFGVEIGASTLRLDREPRALPYQLFFASLSVFVFLCAGLLGVSKSQRGVAAKAPPPG